LETVFNLLQQNTKDTPLSSNRHPQLLVISLSAQEKELIEIKQELDLLKREIRGRQPETVPDPVLDLREAQERIRHYVRAKMSDEMIVTRLLRRGIPREWTLQEIKDIKVAARASDRRSGDSGSRRSASRK